MIRCNRSAFGPKTNWRTTSANRFAREVLFILDFRLYPFLVTKWPGVPVSDNFPSFRSPFLLLRLRYNRIVLLGFAFALDKPQSGLDW